MKNKSFYQIIKENIKKLLSIGQSNKEEIQIEAPESAEEIKFNELFLRTIKNLDFANTEKLLIHGFELKGKTKHQFYDFILEEMANSLISASSLSINNSIFRNNNDSELMRKDLNSILKICIRYDLLDLDFIKKTQSISNYVKDKNEWVDKESTSYKVVQLSKSHYAEMYDTKVKDLENWRHFNYDFLYKHSRASIFNNSLNFKNGLKNVPLTGNPLIDNNHWCYRLPLKDVIDAIDKKDPKVLKTFTEKFNLNDDQQSILDTLLDASNEEFFYLSNSLVPYIIKKEIDNGLEPKVIFNTFKDMPGDISHICVIVLQHYPEFLETVSSEDREFVFQMLRDNLKNTNFSHEDEKSVSALINSYIVKLDDVFEGLDRAKRLADHYNNNGNSSSVEKAKSLTDSDLVDEFILHKKKMSIYSNDFVELSKILDIDTQTHQKLIVLKDLIDNTSELLRISQIDEVKKFEYKSFLDTSSKVMHENIINFANIQELERESSNFNINVELGKHIQSLEDGISEIKMEVLKESLSNVTIHNKTMKMVNR